MSRRDKGLYQQPVNRLIVWLGQRIAGQVDLRVPERQQLKVLFERLAYSRVGGSARLPQAAHQPSLERFGGHPDQSLVESGIGRKGRETRAHVGADGLREEKRQHENPIAEGGKQSRRGEGKG